MFQSQRPILFFSEKKIQPATIAGSAKSQKVKLGEEVPWTKETLTKTLLDIKKKFGGPFSAVLDDDLTFTFGVAIPVGTEKEKDFVRMKAAEEIPEEIGEHGWNYKEILERKDKKEKLAQFVSINNDFYKSFSKAVADSGIKIESVEPMACALARLVSDKPDPTLVIHKTAEKIIILLAERGLVFSTELFETEPTGANIVNFLNFVKEKFGIVPKIVVLSGPLKTLSNKTEEFASLKIEANLLDVFSGAAMISDAAGKAGEILTVPIIAELPSTESKLQNKIVGMAETAKDAGTEQFELVGMTSGDHEKYPQGKWFTYVIFAFCIIIIVTNGMILYQRNQSNQTSVAPPAAVSPVNLVPPPIPAEITTESSTTAASPAASATITTTTTSEATSTNLSAYSIKVLNGSGESGGANKMKSLLENLGFNVVATGNADNFNYKNITVQYKELIPNDYQNALEGALSIRYTISRGSPLDVSEKVDTIIIIGK
jgi:hypothetical protein